MKITEKEIQLAQARYTILSRRKCILYSHVKRLRQGGISLKVMIYVNYKLVYWDSDSPGLHFHTLQANQIIMASDVLTAGS